jgi:hypothetical protein
VNDRDDDIDARLARLGKATENVAPRPDFGARVARALEREPQRGGVLLELGKPARRILPALALAAAVSLVWAVESDQTLDDELSFYADESVELEW